MPVDRARTRATFPAIKTSDTRNLVLVIRRAPWLAGHSLMEGNVAASFRRASLLVLALVALIMTAVSALSATAAKADGASHYGCPGGWVCLSAQNAGLSGAWIGEYYYYGYDNFSNVVGYHTLLNNQTNNAWVYECDNYGGTACYYGFNTGPVAQADTTDFTPINSIRLSATAGNW
jgi:hypothetical protein